VRPEWNTELPRVDLDQVDELLAIIAAHKEIGVTGASVMFSFFKRRIQPIQQRRTLGFEYIGAEDPSRMCAEELTNDAALIRVRRVLLDVDAVPYVPQLFSAQNPPKPVSIRLLFVEISSVVLPLLTANLLQGHTELYRSYPPQPDIPRPDHLLPSAAAEAKRAQAAEALPSSESTEGGSPLAEREAEGEARRSNPPGPSVELAETLPLVSQGRCLVRKRKAHVVESSRYEVAALLNCQLSVLLHANTVLLQSVCFFPRAQMPRGGNRPTDYSDRNGYHRRGGHRTTSWCDLAPSDEYHG
jgi:hypothetical protein